MYAQIAQSVEQRTENPCVVSSILTLGTTTNLINPVITFAFN